MKNGRWQIQAIQKLLQPDILKTS